MSDELDDAVSLAIKGTLDAVLTMLVTNLVERQALLELEAEVQGFSAASVTACVIHAEATCIALGFASNDLLVGGSGIRALVHEAANDANLAWHDAGWPASRPRQAAEIGAAASRAILQTLLPPSP